MRLSGLGFIALLALGMASLTTAAPVVTYVGCEISSDGTGNWGSNTNTGQKIAFRSTDNGTKAWTLPGKTNAYGADGYIFPRTANSSQESSGTYQGSLYTGTRYNDTFSNVTVFINSIQTLGSWGSTAGSGQFTVDVGADSLDDPSAGIGVGVANTTLGLWWRQNDSTTNRTPHLLMTFGAGVVNVVRIRIGILTSRGDTQKPTQITLAGVDAATGGLNSYSRPDWYFFDITNAAPGDTVMLAVNNSANTRSAILGLVFDAETVPNNAPVIDSVSANPSPALFTEAQSATTTVRVASHDADSNALTCAWSTISGPGQATFVSASAATTSVSFAAVGTYVLRATMSDGIAGPVISNLTVQVQAPDGVTYVRYAGAEVSSGTAGWGTSWNSGTKTDFRSTDSDAKAYVLTNHPNGYGKDGYVFWNTNSGVFSDVHTGTRSGAVYSNTTDYITSVAVLGAYGSSPGNYNLGGSGLAMDDPTPGIGPSVPDLNVFSMWVYNDGTSYLTPHVRITLNRRAARQEPIRMGIRTDRGDGQKPDIMALGGAEALNVGQNNYTRPDWYFFDIVNAKAGVELLLAFREGDGAGNRICNFQGLVFDSITIPAKGTLILVQ